MLSLNSWLTVWEPEWGDTVILRAVLLKNSLPTPALCTLSNETSSFFPPGPAAGNSRAGGDGKQVLPCSAHSAPQILALQQEGDGSGSATPRSGGRDNNNRPGTKVSDSFLTNFIFLSKYYLSIWMALSQWIHQQETEVSGDTLSTSDLLCGVNLLQGRCSLGEGLWWYDLETVCLILQGFAQSFLFSSQHCILQTYEA